MITYIEGFMLSKILTSVLFFTLIGCDSKEYKKSENSNVDIVTELNQGNTESVISKLSSRESLSARERYYLASAQSKSGGIDVYSLYPVLEMQLFRKNALEWSDLSKEKNPYLKFMKSQEGVDYKKRAKKREERWNKYRPKIIERNDYVESKPSLEDLIKKTNDTQLNQEDYAKYDKLLNDNYDKVMKLEVDRSHKIDAWYEHSDKIIETDYSFIGYYDLNTYYRDQLELETLKQAYINPDQQAMTGFNIGWEMTYMSILWNTYEAIPLMKQMPTLSDDHQNFVTQALTNYKEILTDKEFKDVALKNIGILAGVSLLSIYKESFDLEEIDSIQDLMCSFEPSVITENYGLIRERIIFLSETYETVNMGTNLEKYKDHLEKLKTQLPENISDEEKADFQKSIEDFKLDRCFNG